MAAGLTGVFDPGLQPERTLLAWRRTNLLLVAGLAAAGRLVLEAMPLVVVGFVTVGIVGGLLVSVWVDRRYRRMAGMLRRDGDRAPIGSGAAPALLAGVAVLISSAVVLVIVFDVVRW